MGRPAEPLIDRAEVIKTALAIIDQHGPDGLNMRTLGKRLGVNAASLYYHFRNKDAILDAVADYILRSGKVARPTRGTDWEDVAMELALTYRAVIVAHPKAALLVSTRRSKYRPATVHQNYEDFLSKLVAAGFTAKRALLAMVAVEVLASGSAIEEAFMGPEVQFDRVDPVKYPTLHRIVEKTRLNVREEFREMCHLMLMGLKAEQEGLIAPIGQIGSRRRGRAARKPSSSRRH